MARTKTKAKESGVSADMLREYRRLYEEGNPQISDAEFDALEEAYRKANPDHPYFLEVGAPVGNSTLRMKTLPYPMGSLPKIHVGPSMDAWLGRFDSGAKIFAADKLDGVAAMIDMTKKSMVMYSRGNGVKGADISHLLPFVKNIGNRIPSAVIRGELVISQSAFRKMNARKRLFKTSRNLVAGIVNSASVHDYAYAVEFIVHSIVDGDDAGLVTRQNLIDSGWVFVRRTLFNVTELEGPILDSFLNSRKESSRFDIDGIVLSAHNRTAESVAFKGENKVVTAIVKSVEWNTSRHGVLKPVVLFDPPVEIDGVSISRATAHNAKFITENGIGPNAEVKIARANEVIPYIASVETPVSKSYAKHVLPKHGGWRWCPNKVDLINLVDSPDTKARKIAFFLSTLGIKGFKERTCLLLVEKGIESPRSLAQAEYEDLCDVLTPRASKQLLASLNEALHGEERVAPDVLAYAIGVFPRGLGMTWLRTIFETIDFGTIMKEDLSILESDVRNATSERIAKMFVEKLDDYRGMIKSIGYKKPKVVRKGTSLKGMSFVFTGLRDKDLETTIIQNGGTVASSVTRDTEFVAASSILSGSSKANRARQLGVDIITLDAARSRIKTLTQKE